MVAVPGYTVHALEKIELKVDVVVCLYIKKSFKEISLPENVLIELCINISLSPRMEFKDVRLRFMII